MVGRNGVGKTTLLRALAGLQKHQGTVRSRRPAARPGPGLPERRPAALQRDRPRRNPLPRPIPTRRCMPGCSKRWAWPATSRSPPLLLSEGEKRRVALATVLMRQPRHGLLLDEPAVGQDSSHKAMLMRTLARALAHAGKLVILPPTTWPWPPRPTG